MKCFLVCFSCKKKYLYSIEDNHCKNCNELIVDPGIKFLVFALNNCGITTERSCEGHDGFDQGYYYDYPWITIPDEKDFEKLKMMIDEYNYHRVSTDEELSPWKTGLNINVLKYWLFPQDIYKNTRTLQKESEMLAEFIMATFGKLRLTVVNK